MKKYLIFCFFFLIFIHKSFGVKDCWCIRNNYENDECPRFPSSQKSTLINSYCKRKTCTTKWYGHTTCTWTKTNRNSIPDEKQCAWGCPDCEESNINQCIGDCLPNYYKNGITCCVECPDGTFSKDWECFACDKGCFKCTSNNQCNECITGLNLFENTCIKTCPDGYYSFQKVCYPCVNNCKTCETQTKCLTCLEKISFFKNTCLENCLDGYYSKDWMCEKCNNNCKTCITLSTHCLSCPTHLQLFDSTCNNNCPDGYFAKDNVCKICSDDCPTCVNNENYCISCPIYKYLLEGQCLSACPQGFYNNNYKCQKCSNNCKDCYQTANYCLTCNTDDYFYQNKCYNMCPKGYYGDSKSIHCEPCYSKCYTCLDNKYNCQSCANTLVLYKEKCIQQDYCDFGQYHNNSSNLCENCSSECQTCTSNVDNCTTCPQYKYLLDSKCVIKCPDSYQQNDIINECLSCTIQNCSACVDDPIKCTKCIDNLFVYQNECIEVCPEDTYILNHKCIECKIGYSEFCKRCDANQCLECEENSYYIENSSFGCAAQCGENQISVNGKCVEMIKNQQNLMKGTFDQVEKYSLENKQKYQLLNIEFDNLNKLFENNFDSCICNDQEFNLQNEGSYLAALQFILGYMKNDFESFKIENLCSLYKDNIFTEDCSFNYNFGSEEQINFYLKYKQSYQVLDLHKEGPGFKERTYNKDQFTKLYESITGKDDLFILIKGINEEFEEIYIPLIEWQSFTENEEKFLIIDLSQSLSSNQEKVFYYTFEYENTKNFFINSFIIFQFEKVNDESLFKKNLYQEVLNTCIYFLLSEVKVPQYSEEVQNLLEVLIPQTISFNSNFGMLPTNLKCAAFDITYLQHMFQFFKQTEQNAIKFLFNNYLNSDFQANLTDTMKQSVNYEAGQKNSKISNSLNHILALINEETDLNIEKDTYNKNYPKQQTMIELKNSILADDILIHQKKEEISTGLINSINLIHSFISENNFNINAMFNSNSNKFIIINKEELENINLQMATFAQKNLFTKYQILLNNENLRVSSYLIDTINKTLSRKIQYIMEQDSFKNIQELKFKITVGFLTYPEIFVLEKKFTKFEYFTEMMKGTYFGVNEDDTLTLSLIEACNTNNIQIFTKITKSEGNVSVTAKDYLVSDDNKKIIIFKIHNQLENSKFSLDTLQVLILQQLYNCNSMINIQENGKLNDKFKLLFEEFPIVFSKNCIGASYTPLKDFIPVSKLRQYSEKLNLNLFTNELSLYKNWSDIISFAQNNNYKSIDLEIPIQMNMEIICKEQKHELKAFIEELNYNPNEARKAIIDLYSLPEYTYKYYYEDLAKYYVNKYFKDSKIFEKISQNCQENFSLVGKCPIKFLWLNLLSNSTMIKEYIFSETNDALSCNYIQSITIIVRNTLKELNDEIQNSICTEFGLAKTEESPIILKLGIKTDLTNWSELTNTIMQSCSNFDKEELWLSSTDTLFNLFNYKRGIRREVIGGWAQALNKNLYKNITLFQNQFDLYYERKYQNDINY